MKKSKLPQTNFFQWPTQFVGKEIFTTFVGYMDWRSPQSLSHSTSRIQRKEHYTVHYVLKGKGTLFLEGKTYQVKENQCFILPPYIPVSYTPNIDDPWIYTWITFDGSLVLSYLSAMNITTQNPIHTFSDASFYDEVVQFLNNGPYDNLFYPLSFLLHLFGEIMKDKGLNFEVKYNNKSEFVKKITESISSNYSNPDFKVRDIANYINISHSYMCKIFSEQNRCSVSQFLISTRMNKATDLLRTTNLPVKEIAFAVGYANEVHFFKSFNKHFGMSPGAFRKKYVQ